VVKRCCGVPDAQRGKVGVARDFARQVKEHPGLYRQLVQQSAGMVENGMAFESFRIVKKRLNEIFTERIRSALCVL
jgi:hypothetical protein